MKAFPNVIPKENFQAVDEGMDLRDYFAAKAMQGLLSSLDSKVAYDWSNDAIATDCELYYKIADAMIEARES